MAFVNEFISEEDVKKYGLEEIDQRYVVGGTSARDWTVDKDRNIYLRHVANGPREPELFGQGKWTLLWEGQLIEIGIDIVDSGSQGAVRWSRKQVRYLTIPPNLQSRRQEIISCLGDALAAYKDGGVFSMAGSYQLTLDVK